MPSVEARDGSDRPQYGIRSFHTLPADATGTVRVLEHLVRRFPRVHEGEWATRLAEGRVFWDDGSAIGVDTLCEAGRRLVYERDVPGESEPVEPLRILYQDDEILVADKPHGIPVTPSGQYVRRSLLAQARLATSNTELTPAHRIDQETAGLVLFVQRVESRASYQGLFARRQVHKVYRAIGRGSGEPPAFTTVKGTIVRSEDYFRWRTAPDESGRARTDVYRVRRLEGERSSWPGSLGSVPNGSDRWEFRVVPESGRPHQVRLHLAQLGFPIFGDPLYPERRVGSADEGPLQLLAAELRFRDPIRPRWRFFSSERSLSGLD